LVKQSGTPPALVQLPHKFTARITKALALNYIFHCRKNQVYFRKMAHQTGQTIGQIYGAISKTLDFMGKSELGLRLCEPQRV